MSGKLIRAAGALLVLIAVVLYEPEGTAALAPNPFVDTALALSTPLPDADLIVVREKFYAGSVDLTPFGVGTGADDFVQSIYFRLLTGDLAESSISGAVSFPPGVTILGFISDDEGLGGSGAPGAYGGSDAFFAVSPNPADYQLGPRGFESLNSNPGTSEYICQLDERSFIFGLNVTNGIDDFRVIVDYGNDFNSGRFFRVDLHEEPLGGVSSSLGIVLGDPAGGVLGAGDHGEVSHLIKIPLTVSDAPQAGSGPPTPNPGLIYLSRETAMASKVDGLDVRANEPIPALLEVPTSTVLKPRALAFTDDGMLYMMGEAAELAAIDPHTGAVTPLAILDETGINVRMTSLAGDPRLFILRQTSFPDQDNAWVDTYDTTTGQFTSGFTTFPLFSFLHPVDIAGGTDGLIYAVGLTGEFHAVNPVSGARVPTAFVPDLPGSIKAMEADPSDLTLYFLRDTGGIVYIDSLDMVTGAFHEAIASVPAGVLNAAGPMVMDNDGMLWLFGRNGGIAGVDPRAPGVPPFYITTCMDFAGLTTNAAIARNPREVSPVRGSQPLRVEPSPLAGMLRIHWEDIGVPGLRYNVYQGSLPTPGSETALACHIPGTSDGLGGLYMDTVEPTGNRYYLVTASTQEGEGSAGPRRLGPGAACGPIP